MGIPVKQLAIPDEVSGRKITNRGVHIVPQAYHGEWLKNFDYWIELLHDMGISWVVLMNSGDSVKQEYGTGMNPIEALLDNGVIPIIREAQKFPKPFTDMETFLWTVGVYNYYGLKPFWIIRNEPFDYREWAKGEVPDNAWSKVMEVWASAATFIASNGGYVGFPDGPCYAFNPFESIKQYDCQWIFDEGLGYYTGHHYGKNRPRDYPYDAVTRNGALLTEEDYARLLDDYADNRQWWEEPMSLINKRRLELQNPTLSAVQDDTCWRGWEKVAHWSMESFGYVVPMAMTEGGWVPRDRPGTGPNTDIRMPHTTPRMVAKKTLQMYDTPSPFFAICPWLLADDAMVLGGYVGWPFDAWVGWAYSPDYGYEKPVVDILTAFPPIELSSRQHPLVIDINSDSREWSFVEDEYKAKYKRGDGSLRLIEVHEYFGEGPKSKVLDGNGFPVDVDLVVPGADTFKSKAKEDGKYLYGVWLSRDGGEPLPPELPVPPEPPCPPEPPESPSGYVWTIEYQHGLMLIVGSVPESGLTLTLSDPWGNDIVNVSGHKPEYGEGGFEFWAAHEADYKLRFSDTTITIPMKKDQFAKVTVQWAQ